MDTKKTLILLVFTFLNSCASTENSAPEVEAPKVAARSTPHAASSSDWQWPTFSPLAPAPLTAGTVDPDVEAKADTQDVIRLLSMTGLFFIALFIFSLTLGRRRLADVKPFQLAIGLLLPAVWLSAVLNPEITFLFVLLAYALLLAVYGLVSWGTPKETKPKKYSLDPGAKVIMVNGKFLEDPSSPSRLNREEILSALRSQGVKNPDEIGGLLMEPNGTLVLLEGKKPHPLVHLH